MTIIWVVCTMYIWIFKVRPELGLAWPKLTLSLPLYFPFFQLYSILFKAQLAIHSRRLRTTRISKAYITHYHIIITHYNQISILSKLYDYKFANIEIDLEKTNFLSQCLFQSYLLYFEVTGSHQKNYSFVNPYLNPKNGQNCPFFSSN